MKIHNMEVDFRLSNLKHAGAMDLALKHMEQKEKEINARKGSMQITEVLEKMIELIRAFLVEATGTDVLQGCEDLQEAQKAYADFLNAVRMQKEELLAPFSLERIE